MRTRSLFALVLALSILALWTTPSNAYERYRTQGGNRGCSDCHPGFIDRDTSHDIHVGSSQMTGTCGLCHVSTGDNPRTDFGGATGAQSCRGCHGIDNGTASGWGSGLRRHHTAAGAPPDADGLFCADCHVGDPDPGAENLIPVHYLRSDVNVKDPCSSTTSDGEDWDGDGEGLDNDGDLVYDEADDDCSALGVSDVASEQPMILSVSPNPSFGGAVEILYDLPGRANVTVRVLDASGRQVAHSHHAGLAAGPHRYRFDTRASVDRDLPSGVYVAEIVANGMSVSARLVLIR